MKTTKIFFKCLTLFFVLFSTIHIQNYLFGMEEATSSSTPTTPSQQKSIPRSQLTPAMVIKYIEEYPLADLKDEKNFEFLLTTINNNANNPNIKNACKKLFNKITAENLKKQEFDALQLAKLYFLFMSKLATPIMIFSLEARIQIDTAYKNSPEIKKPNDLSSYEDFVTDYDIHVILSDITKKIESVRSTATKPTISQEKLLDLYTAKISNIKNSKNIAALEEEVANDTRLQKRTSEQLKADIKKQLEKIQKVEKFFHDNEAFFKSKKN